MSLLNYFRKKAPEKHGILLPKVDGEQLASEVVACMNARVLEERGCQKLSESWAEVEPKPRKVTQYALNTTRDSDDKYAALHRLAAAVKHFSGLCGHAVLARVNSKTEFSDAKSGKSHYNCT